MRYLALAAILFIYINPNDAHSQVYRWVDEHGQTHFGDKKPDHVDSESFKISEPQVIERIKPRTITPHNTRSAGLGGATGAPSIINAPVSQYEGITIKIADFSNRELPGSNFSNSTLSQVKFDNSNLAGSDFSGARIDRVSSFAGANLSGTNFSNAELTHVDFSNTNLANADLSNVYCFGCKFENAIMHNVNVDGIRLFSVTFKYADFKNTNFINYDSLREVDFRASNMDIDSIEISDRKLSLIYTVDNCDIGEMNTDCSHVDLSGHKFRSGGLMEVDFTGANLSGADFGNAQLVAINFTDAVLDNANMPGWINGSTFHNTSLVGARLKSVSASNFINADLRNANLKDAEIYADTVFENTKLNGADFTNARIISAVFRNSPLDDAIITNASINPYSIQPPMEKAVDEVETRFAELEKLLDDGSHSPEQSNHISIVQELKNIEKSQAPVPDNKLKKLLYKLLTHNNFRVRAEAIDFIYNRELNLSSSDSYGEVFCKDKKISWAALGFIKESHEARYPGIYRKRALDCIRHFSYQDTEMLLAIVDMLLDETDKAIKSDMILLLNDLAPDITLPLLKEYTNTPVKDFSLAIPAFNAFQYWDQPPIDILEDFLGSCQKNMAYCNAYSDSLYAYGARALPYYDRFHEIIDMHKKAVPSPRKFKENIERLDIYLTIHEREGGHTRTNKSLLDDILLPLDTDSGLEWVTLAPTFTRLGNSSSSNDSGSRFHTIRDWITSLLNRLGWGADELENPLYSTRPVIIETVISQMPAHPKINANDIQAVAAVEYVFDEYYYDGHAGIYALVFADANKASKVAESVLKNAPSRRLFVVSGQVLIMLWSDGYIDNHIHSDILDHVVRTAVSN